MRRRVGGTRFLAAGGVLAAAVFLGAPVTPPSPGSPCPCEITPHSTLEVIHIEVSRGGPEFPYIREETHLYVDPRYVPESGLVRVTLQARRTIFARFTNRGSTYFRGPWKAGWTGVEGITTPCIYLTSWWRLKFVWDFVTYDGKKASGTDYWPLVLGRPVGRRFTCKIIEVRELSP